MKERRVFRIIELELDPEVEAQAVYLAARWVYFHPPRIVFEPSAAKPLFLPSNSNRMATLPKG